MLKNEDFLENASLDKMTVGEMKVGKECHVNNRHNPYFGVIQNFTSVGQGEMGLVIYDKKGERHEVHNDWIYHHPAIIDRTDECYSFAGEVILAPTFDGKKEKGIYIICQVNPGEFKLIGFSSGSFPNRYSGISINGKMKRDCNGINIYSSGINMWFSIDHIKDVMKDIFNDAEFTGMTLEQYVNEQ